MHLLVAMLLVGSFNAGQRPCTSAQQHEADIRADELKSWDAVHQWYLAYARCENAAATEGYSESVARLLVDHWSTLPHLVKLGRTDKHFLEYAVGGVNATLDMADVKPIDQLARDSCPASAKSVCELLRRNAKQALAEDAAVQGVK